MKRIEQIETLIQSDLKVIKDIEEKQVSIKSGKELKVNWGNINENLNNENEYFKNQIKELEKKK